MPLLAPLVPINYFGKGKDYSLSDDQAEIQEFERQWREWEAEHPDDPTGEIALREFEAIHGEVKTNTNGSVSRKAVRVLQPVISSVEPIARDGEVMEDMASLELEMPKSAILALKRYASFKRVRPRDVVTNLILKHCKF